MIGKNLMNEINEIGEDIIEEALNAASLKEGKKPRVVWSKWVLPAACLCILTCSFVFILFLQKRNIPLPESGNIQASDIAPKNTGVILAGGTGTKAYFTMDAEKLSDLMKSPVKDNNDAAALNVYQSVNVADLRAYFAQRMQEITDNAKNNLGITLTAENYTAYEDFNSYWVDLMSDNFRINMDTSNDYGTTETRYRIWDSDTPVENLALFGDEIAIAADESEESIKNKLSDALDFANKIFNTDYTFQSITRNLEYSAEGDFTVYVNAYEASNDINQAMYNQYLNSMSFLFMGDNESNIKLIGIYYTKYELKRAFTEATALLSVSDAKNYLKNGYIFAGHVCPVCMSRLKEVDLSDYDGLEVVYRTDTFGKYVIPFYAFYKKTGQYRYAVAYVPAVAVGGLKEYFEAQEAWHNTDK